jgi:hypothetical protein
MTAPYYSDDRVTLYHGDCREEGMWWVNGEVLITDPPYGRGWYQHAGLTDSKGRGSSKSHDGIAGDKDTTTRDAALEVWGNRPAVVFGDPLVTPPRNAAQALVWRKPADAGVKGARVGHRRDVEMVYLVGPWAAGVGGRSSVITSSGWVAGPSGPAAIHGHPHAKPGDLMEYLVALTTGTVADPFAGSGATLVAAKALGRTAIGVEIEERYCEVIAKRLAQDVLDFGETSRCPGCGSGLCQWQRLECERPVTR